MFTGAWKALVEIIYNTTGSLFVGVYLYALLTLMEIFSLSVIIMHIAEKIRTRKRKMLKNSLLSKRNLSFL